MEFLEISKIALLALTISIAILLVKYSNTKTKNRDLSRKNKNLTDKYASITDIDQAFAKQSRELKDLQEEYRQKKSIYDDLRTQVAIYDEKISLAELGIYSPHFQYEDSDQFKASIQEVRAMQKEMISNKSAIVAHIDWTVENSKYKGKQMIDRAIKLSLLAFNNECETTIANIKWNNATSMEKRITKAYQSIDKLNKSLHICISEQYYHLKLEELRLTHEYREKRKAEKDQIAEMRRLQREEEKSLIDAKKALKEEEKYQKLLDKARKEVASDQASYTQKIDELTRKLHEAHERSERAKSMAEQTRAGFIYVISNIGSFGENIYKIGMTRRLDPRLRIQELGDASVPFRFDTHIFFYCLDAPKVEKELHDAFSDRRVNAINARKEFFAVPLQEIASKINEIEPSAEVISRPEAEEYQQTLLLRDQSTADQTAQENRFPESL